MGRLLNFNLFEREIQGNQTWDSDYDSLDTNPIWRELQSMGFVNATTPIMAKNKSLLIKNPGFAGFYPGGIVLQKSGYIRDKMASSGFISNKIIGLDNMLNYVLDRYKKEFSKREAAIKSLEGSGLENKHADLIFSSTKAKWLFNKSTGKVDVGGSIEIDLREDPGMIDILPQIKFGKINGDFRVILPPNFDQSSPLPFSFDSVGGNFYLNNTSRNKLESLKGIGQVRNGEIFIHNEIGPLESKYSDISLSEITECEELNLYKLFHIKYDIDGCFMVLRDGCIEKSWRTQRGLEFTKKKASEAEDRSARKVILTSPLLKEDSVYEFVTKPETTLGEIINLYIRIYNIERIPGSGPGNLIQNKIEKLCSTIKEAMGKRSDADQEIIDGLDGMARIRKRNM